MHSRLIVYKIAAHTQQSSNARRWTRVRQSQTLAHRNCLAKTYAQTHDVHTSTRQLADPIEITHFDYTLAIQRQWQKRSESKWKTKPITDMPASHFTLIACYIFFCFGVFPLLVRWLVLSHGCAVYVCCVGLVLDSTAASCFADQLIPLCRLQHFHHMHESGWFALHRKSDRPTMRSISSSREFKAKFRSNDAEWKSTIGHRCRHHHNVPHWAATCKCLSLARCRFNGRQINHSHYWFSHNQMQIMLIVLKSCAHRDDLVIHIQSTIQPSRRISREAPTQTVLDPIECHITRWSYHNEPNQIEKKKWY